MTTIHYALRYPDPITSPGTGRGGSEFARLARQTINIARRICSEMDEITFDEPIITAD